MKQLKCIKQIEEKKFVANHITVGKIYEQEDNYNDCDDYYILDNSGIKQYYEKHFFEEIKQCSIVESVRKQLLDRSNVGLLKYGVTLDRDDLSLLDWLEHAKQEQMDSVLYLEKIIQELRKNKL